MEARGILGCAISGWPCLVVLRVAFCLALMMVATMANHRNSSAKVINAYM